MAGKDLNIERPLENADGKRSGKVEKCALCRELRGTVRIQDAKGRELRICLRCDRLIDWQ